MDNACAKRYLSVIFYRLEIERSASYRGFKSRPFRSSSKASGAASILPPQIFFVVAFC
jgi:hypothetical protein